MLNCLHCYDNPCTCAPENRILHEDFNFSLFSEKELITILNNISKELNRRNNGNLHIVIRKT
jgi:hypothetical protein